MPEINEPNDMELSGSSADGQQVIDEQTLIKPLAAGMASNAQIVKDGPDDGH